jgi:hypothetical protein
MLVALDLNFPGLSVMTNPWKVGRSGVLRSCPLQQGLLVPLLPTSNRVVWANTGLTTALLAMTQRTVRSTIVPNIA